MQTRTDLVLEFACRPSQSPAFHRFTDCRPRQTRSVVQRSDQSRGLMSHVLQLAALSGFGALMLAAAIEDIRRLVIPNSLVLALLALWPLGFATAAEPNLAAGLAAAACAGSVFVGGAMAFARGLVGGGDVKLLSVAALWVGADGIAPLLAMTALLGGVLAIACLSPLGGWLGAWQRRFRNPVEAIAGPDIATAVPYGAAIAGAALFVILGSYNG
jgi:prepilin peptidase CpaA